MNLWQIWYVTIWNFFQQFFVDFQQFFLLISAKTSKISCYIFLSVMSFKINRQQIYSVCSMTWTSIQRISTASRNLILETTLLTVLSKFSFYFLVLLSISFSFLFCTVSCSWFWSFYHFDRYERGIYVMLYMENWFGKSMRNFSKVIIFFPLHVSFCSEKMYQTYRVFLFV
jgi:hypothetical protein